MKYAMVRWGTACLVLAAMAGCGGGGGSGQPAASVAVMGAIASASAVAANDTATNSSASFTVVQDAGIPAVTINSPPKVNFAVFSDGAVKTDVTIASVSFAIAKLVPGTNNNPDQWVNYIYRTETPATPPPVTTPPTPSNNVGSAAGGLPVLASAKQATSDGKLSAAELLALQLPAQLVYNPAGYYTYTFKTDIKDTTKTNGVVFEPTLTHRVAVQLSYTNAAGETVRVNPYFDFTIDASGNSVPVTDPAQTRKMTDVASCNGCHEKLALHGGGRVDTQYCVMCHNPGTTDANSGNRLDLSTMVHKIHAGRLLKSKLDAGQGGEDYTIWGYGSSKHSYAAVGFPQDLRNCTKCHSGANPKTPQGDNWKSKPSKEACLSCHASGAGSVWRDGTTVNTVVVGSHTAFAAQAAAAGFITGGGTDAKDLTNQLCAGCHSPGSAISPERVHFNQNEENAAKYKMNIESTTYDATTRKVTVKYFLSDPTNANAAYNLVTPDCTFSTPNVCTPPTGTNNTKFGNLRFYLAYQNMVGQLAAVTEYSAFNNGGGNVNVSAYTGANDGSNHYTIELTVPADTATAVAAGTARVVSTGQVKEPKLEVKSATDPRPEVTPKVFVNTVVQHTYKELALTGTLNPRRVIVSNEKCNVCHSLLGTTSGSNTLENAFHRGERDTVESCVLCHDANRMSSGKMTNGLDLNESRQFKRLIHGIHGNSKRTYPYAPGNAVVAEFNKDGTRVGGGASLASKNYAAEVAWPGIGINCNACHVDNSYKSDSGTLGTVIKKDAGVTDPNGWKVISPKAATCTACHDSPKAMGHVTSFGGASFGDKTQAEIAGLPRETCDECHASGVFKGVDIVHGQK